MEKTEKPPAKQEAPAPEKKDAAPEPAKKGKFGLVGLVGGIMVVEGVAVFMCMKFLGSDPDPTVGMEQTQVPTTRPWQESNEIMVAKVRVLNNSGAKAMLYNVKVVIRVNHQKEQRVADFIESRKNTVQDVISRVIRSAEERHLSEPGLETLKRQVRHELGALLGDDSLIEQVLIPECMPMPAGY